MTVNYVHYQQNVILKKDVTECEWPAILHELGAKSDLAKKRGGYSSSTILDCCFANPTGPDFSMLFYHEAFHHQYQLP